MATLATYLTVEQEEQPTLDEYGFRDLRVSCVVRQLPAEGIYFWRKPEIDNGGVVAQDDPNAWDLCWKAASFSLLFVVVVVCLLLPAADGALSSIRLAQADARHTKLKEELKRLKLVEAELTNPERLHALARSWGYVEPARVHFLRAPDQPMEALLRRTPAGAAPASGYTAVVR